MDVEIESTSAVLIPWTGGFDSTALILKALLENRQVYAPYTFIINNREGCCAEVAARARIHKYLSSIGMWNGPEPETSYTVHEHSTKCDYAYPKWIALSCMDMPANIGEIWIGYTLSDRTAQGFNLDHHCNLIQTISAMLIMSNHRSAEVKFPFYDTDKTEMLKYYQTLKTRKVFEMIANCATGLSYDSGCRCPKCMKMDALRTILDRKIPGQ